MKKFTLLLILLHCFLKTSAQNTFEKVIDTLGNSGATCIQETFDGGYIFCGSTTVGGNRILINKIDSIGTIEWVKQYSATGSENVTYIEQTPDSGYIVNGSYNIGPNTKSWLLKLDANGDTLWTKTFSVGVGATEPPENNSMAVFNNSIYGLIGNYQTTFPIASYASFMSVLNNGILLSAKLYGTTAYGTGASAINQTNDGFIIGGSQLNANGVSTDCYLVRTDPYGDTLWTRTFNFSNSEVIKSVKKTPDGGLIAGGLFFNPSSLEYNILILKTDSLGDTLWSKQYWQNFSENIYGMEQTSDGGYVITGYTTTPLGQTAALMLLKTDSVGNIEWTKLYGSGNQLSLGTYIKQTKDRGFIICGLNNNVGNGGTYLIKTDSLGNVLTGLDVPELNNQISLLVYPNPVSEEITVKAKNIVSKNALLAIYNITGKCVYNSIIQNNETTTIDVKCLANGIYMMQVTSEDSRLSRKIVVSR